MATAGRITKAHLSAALLAAAMIAPACGRPAADPCSARDPCAAGASCVVGVCREDKKPLAPAKSRRVVLLARDVAVLSSQDRVARDAEVTPFGARSAGEIVVLLGFDGELGATADVAAAMLVVDPEPASPGPAQEITVEAAEVLSPWVDSDATWGRSPRIGPPIGAGAIAPARRAPLRIDVTRSITRTRGSGFGLALRASGDDPVGARMVTAAGASAGPRLELYLK
jgi:hypothetical protein